MTDDELEAPAYLGRTVPAAADPMAHLGKGQRLDPVLMLDMIGDESRRDRSLGYLVMLSALLVVGALGFAGEGWWVYAGLCAISGAFSTYGAVRRARRRVREEMERTLMEPGMGKPPGSAPG